MYISVDIEADGPIPGDFSMIWFGAVIIDRDLETTFEGKLAPISSQYNPTALAISRLTREETLEFPHPLRTMIEFGKWIEDNRLPGENVTMWSDNNGFDWGFINYYFHHFTGGNPLGFSSERINSLYHGAAGSMRKSFKHLRVTKHTHNPVDDAKGNAEALKQIFVDYDIELPKNERARLL